METVVALFPSYPIFLWITGCKILFIVGDQFWKTRFHHFHSDKKMKKKPYESSNCHTYSRKGKLYPQWKKLLLTF